MEQKPSIGRIVHFETDEGPFPAIITAVRSGGTEDFLSLCVMHEAAISFQGDVHFNPDGGAGTWRWPPRV